MRPGEQRLKTALQRRRNARNDDPTPYDDAWGWWIEQRLSRIEAQQKWLITLAAGTIIVEVIKLIFN